MVTSKQLDAMSEQSIETLDEKELIDISTINIRKDLHHEDKILDFLDQIKNPYCFRCDNVFVRVCFSKKGKNLETVLRDFLIRIRQS
ncbi:MAG: hypothetical protein LBR30_04935 [Clostridioides sp.]|nr:hypothetical protein [Clostridioides sp.]